MPRGFLVKRNKHTVSTSYRVRSLDSDDYTVDIPSKGDQLYTQPFNSPDSGYGHSPNHFMPISHCNNENETLSFHLYKGTLKPLLPIAGHKTPPSRLPPSSPIQEGEKLSPSPELPTLRLPLSAPVIGNACKRVLEGMGSKTPKAKRLKAARRITFDDDTRSPVHGTIIKELSDDEDNESSGYKMGRSSGGLGGDFICQLCREEYPDPLSLAQHKCSRIVHVEYRCPECDKVFNCPANLASHRRWHKPRQTLKRQAGGEKTINTDSPSSDNNTQPASLLNNNVVTPTMTSDMNEMKMGSEEAVYQCEHCDKRFRRPTNLRKHLQLHNEEGNFLCQFCGKIFGSLANRNKHMVTHTVAQGPDLPHEGIVTSCMICSTVFGSEDALIQHQQLFHSHQALSSGATTIHLYPCKYCTAYCSSTASLAKHIDERHQTEQKRSMLLNVPVRI